MQIGFVGLGAMGAAMARNLLASGHDVCVYNRSPARAEPLRDAGATVAASPAAAVQWADVVFTMVSDDAALASVMTAGADEDLKMARPLLEQLGQSVATVGSDPSQANLVKLIGNFMLTVIVETLGEACAVAGMAGIDPMRVVELLTNAPFDAPPYKIYGPAIAAQRFQPAGFALPLAQKDNRLMLAAAQALGVPLPLASFVHDRFLAVRLLGFGPEHDLSALARAALADAGVAAPA